MDDVVIPAGADIPETTGENGNEDYYSVPQRGQPPTFYWPNNSNLLADHVTAGSFQSAIRLLDQQLGIVNITPFKQIFMSFYARYFLIFNLSFF